MVRKNAPANSPPDPPKEVPSCKKKKEKKKRKRERERERWREKKTQRIYPFSVSATRANVYVDGECSDWQQYNQNHQNGIYPSHHCPQIVRIIIADTTRTHLFPSTPFYSSKSLGRNRDFVFSFLDYFAKERGRGTMVYWGRGECVLLLYAVAS